MERRYHRRTLSPPGSARRVVNTSRPSGGSLYPVPDPYYAPPRVSRDVPSSPRSPRAGGDRFLYPERPIPRGYAEETPPLLKPRAGYSRTRRATLDTEGPGGRRPTITTTGPGLRPVVHASPVERASSLVSKNHRPDADRDYYLTPGVSSRRSHRRSFSTDNNGGSCYTRQIEGPEEYGHRVPADRADYRNLDIASSRKGYHLSGPLVRHPDVDNGQYGYDAYGGYGYGNTDPEEDFYREPALRQRRRGDSTGEPPRRERPLSMVNLENYPPRGSNSSESGYHLDPRGVERSIPMTKSVSADRRVNRPSVDEKLRNYPPLRPGDPYEDSSARTPRKNPILHHDRDNKYASHHEDLDMPRDRDRDRRDRDRDYDDHHELRSHRNDPHSVDSSPYHSPDLSSDPDEGTHRRRRRHRHRDETLAAATAVGAGAGLDHAARERDGRGKLPSSRDDRDKENRDRERRDRKPRDPGVSSKTSRIEKDIRDRDTGDRDVRKRETREREGREHEGRERDAWERRPRDRNSVARSAEEPPRVDLRDRQPRERDPREREKAGDEVDRHGERSGKQQVRVVSPPREKEKEGKEVKGILRQPREKFPEDPEPVREGVAPLKEALKDGKKGIPPGARWTKVDRKLVNPAALEEAQERFEERLDHVIVLRVLTRDEIEKFAARTQEIRGTYICRAPQGAVTATADGALTPSSSTDARYDRDKTERDRRRRKDGDGGRGDMSPQVSSRARGDSESLYPIAQQHITASPTEAPIIREPHPPKEDLRRIEASSGSTIPPNVEIRSSQGSDMTSGTNAGSVSHTDSSSTSQYPPPPSVSSVSSVDESTATASSSKKSDPQ